MLAAGTAYGISVGAGGFYGLSLPMRDVADNYDMCAVGFDGRASFLASLKKAVAGGRKTPSLVPLVACLRSFRAAPADVRLQYKLTGRP